MRTSTELESIATIAPLTREEVDGGNSCHTSLPPHTTDGFGQAKKNKQSAHVTMFML